ncbi:MAG: FAD/NAD(P)-binding protein [Bacteroidales bacterium]
MKKIVIVGCGFSGTMTAIHLIRKATCPFELILTGDSQSFNKGIAYHPNSNRQLLNVIASRMSAFADKPDDFTDWVLRQEEFSKADRGLLANTYLPRYLYGQYLEEIWQETLLSSEAGKVQIRVINALATEMDVSEKGVLLALDNGESISASFCVIATGNLQPANPVIQNTPFFSSPRYFRNPWDFSTIRNQGLNGPVLILGNGLTMADTVIGLLENGFSHKIYTVSPHGFTILPHRHLGISYSAVREELQHISRLSDMVRIVNRHIRLAVKSGFSAEPVIDALRPLTQQLWRNLTIREKRSFLTHVRHLWDSARHRIPMHIHDMLFKLKESGQLNQFTGKLISVSESEGEATVVFSDTRQNSIHELKVAAVINCTGPSTDPMKSDDCFIKTCLQNGTLIQDELKLGLLADPNTFEVFNRNLELQENIFILGSLLKGVLWESTAVKELREQAEGLAGNLVRKVEASSRC